jgi:hypothetical protein
LVAHIYTNLYTKEEERQICILWRSASKQVLINFLFILYRNFIFCFFLDVMFFIFHESNLLWKLMIIALFYVVFVDNAIQHKQLRRIFEKSQYNFQYTCSVNEGINLKFSFNRPLKFGTGLCSFNVMRRP